jgi:endonuclease I
MKKLFFYLSIIFVSSSLWAQPTGYYNGTEGKTGTELKNTLNDIISGHMEWAYFYADNVFIDSDGDPTTPGNVITVYKGSSVDGGNYGTGGDFLNREHVWAKSHGQFDTDLPTGGDLHNLKPADGSVNVDRSNKDFDNCQATGTQHAEATGCYYTSDAWEPRDEVKGDIARIIFYMATRYEGENGEVDLEVNDQVSNSPNPYHGRLSALLQWHEQDPPDDFERNRNDVIFKYQQNRNPFIDHPEWVGMIWESDPANSISIGNVSQSQELVFTGDIIDIEATITGTGTISATLNWGTEYTNLTNSITMNSAEDVFTAQIPAQANEADVYFSITANDDNGTYTGVTYMYHVEAIFAGTIQTIREVQGEQAASPFENQVVTISGVVTANFGDGFFLQDGPGAWDGIYVYDVLNPKVGDSIILSGTIKEYYDLTELVDVTDYYLISQNNTLPEPIMLTIDELDESYEGVLINIPSGTCTSTDEGYGMWEVSDNTGYLKIHNNQVFEFTPTLNETYSISGPLKWDYGEWKIELRSSNDIAEGVDLIKPEIDEVIVTSAEYIKVIFNENIDDVSAAEIQNYAITDGINVINAYRNSFLHNNIFLQVSGLSLGTHEITVTNIKDLAGNIMDPQTISFNSEFTGITDLQFSNYTIFPNPSKGKITITNAALVKEVNLMDVSGKVIQTIAGGISENIEVYNLQNGVYLIQIVDILNNTSLKKVIVQ